MHSRFALFIALPCLGLAAFVCTRAREAPSSGTPVTAPVPIETVVDGPSGSMTTNGLHPDAYHRDKVALTLLMNNRLMGAMPGKLAKGFDAILDGGTGGMEKLVEYTLDCALQARTFASSSREFSNNHGLLTTTRAWPDDGLKVSMQEDLHTCLATRLNPSLQEVPIWLAGEHVAQRTDAGEYSVEEAYWAAKVRGTAPEVGIDIHVWPSPTLDRACSQSGAGGTVRALSRRVCGTAGGTCGLTPHHDWDDCRAGDAGSRCSLTPDAGPNQVVIKTQMRCEDWCTLYPDCRIPAECADGGLPQCPDGGTTHTL